MTLHESKHAGYTDLGRLHQHFIGEPPLPAPAPPFPQVPGGPTPPITAQVAAQVASQASRRPQRALYKHADLGSLRAGGGGRPPSGEDQDCFDLLARLAEPEAWSSQGDPTWVLREYVEWTFERLHQQRQVPTSPDGAYSVFNTGLATPQQETVFGLFAPNRNPDGPPWQFAGWLAESDRQLLSTFPELPGYACYTETPSDFVYDSRRELTVSPKHLLESQENLGTLPDPLRSNPYQAGLVLEGAIRRAEARVRRSYRAAVPSWDPLSEKVQLLLPLSLTTPETVDVALVVTQEGESYRGQVMLGLDLAYARARQIARPEEWLNGRG